MGKGGVRKLQNRKEVSESEINSKHFDSISEEEGGE